MNYEWKLDKSEGITMADIVDIINNIIDSGATNVLLTGNPFECSELIYIINRLTFYNINVEILTNTANLKESYATRLSNNQLVSLYYILKPEDMISESNVRKLKRNLKHLKKNKPYRGILTEKAHPNYYWFGTDTSIDKIAASDYFSKHSITFSFDYKI